ncbi:MAG: FAD-binding oxidoreductase [Nocardioides sp.]|nr:FAD-binding oxidoreductase [Nocardioides sp.]
MSRIIVVGAGVVGLSVAVELLGEGHRVDVVARDLPRETTSAVAAAIWYPHLLDPDPRVLGWAEMSYRVLAGIAASDPESGVRLVHGTEVLSEPTAVPWWVSAVPDLRSVRDVPEPYDTGWQFTAPVVEMPRYLDWLGAEVHRLGGSITRLNVSALPEGADAVVNCSGLGARHLGADPSVRPVRGQVVLVEQVGLDTWWLDGAGPTYVVPREHDIVVGGTHEDGEWSRTPSPASTSAILARAMRLVPDLVGGTVLGTRVGLRPWRPVVRLDRDRDVVHCYGHGGAGVTLSWGCAREVAALLS